MTHDQVYRAAEKGKTAARTELDKILGPNRYEVSSDSQGDGNEFRVRVLMHIRRRVATQSDYAALEAAGWEKTEPRKDGRMYTAFAKTETVFLLPPEVWGEVERRWHAVSDGHWQTVPETLRNRTAGVTFQSKRQNTRPIVTVFSFLTVCREFLTDEERAALDAQGWMVSTDRRTELSRDCETFRISGTYSVEDIPEVMAGS